MTLEQLPQPIKDHILRNANLDDYIGKPNTYSVTELLYCVRKSYFKRVASKPMTIEQAFNLYRGKVFDNLWTPLFKHNQVRSTYRCRNIPITISGKYDFIDENGVLVDLKTTKSLYFVNEPGPEYVKQVRFYAWLNSIPKARILYIDFGDCKAFDVDVGDCTELLNELEDKAAKLYMALLENKPPEKSIILHDWLCKCCDYKEECNQ